MVDTLDDTGTALLRGVLDDPAEDAPRLVYADWLEEHGKSDRAEYIRLQCELRKPPPYCYNADRSGKPQLSCPPGTPYEHEECALYRRRFRRETLIGDQYVRNCGPWSWDFIRTVLGRNCLQLSAAWQWWWERGFVHTMSIPGEDWVNNADAILAAQPVQVVAMTTLPGVNQSTTGNLPGYVWFDPPAGRKMVRTALLGINLGDSVSAALLRHHWPRIAFTLPR